MTVSVETIAERLQTACRRRFGAAIKVTGLERLSAGASSHTWRFEMQDGADSSRLILQLFAGGSQYPGANDKRTQALVQSAAFKAGVPTPEVLLICEVDDALGEGFVTRCHDGETLGQRIVRDSQLEAARARLTTDCANALARIHTMELGALPSLAVRGPEAALQQLTEAHRSYGADLPVIELGLQWLVDRIPRPVRPVLVHGDFRNGNFIVGPEGLRQVLDWEMAHLGDPGEDLGWLTVNAWRFGRIDLPVGGFGERKALLESYAQARGSAVDYETLRFWQMFGTVQWGVMCQWFAAEYLSGRVPDFERIAIGRRLSEVQIDIMDLLRDRD